MYSWKKILALLISVLMLLSLVACGGGEETKEPAEKPNEPTPNQNNTEGLRSGFVPSDIQYPRVLR